jgi:hypothetical protein
MGFFSMARQPYMGLGLLVSSRFYDHTLFRHTTLGRTPLDEWPARRRDLYLATHNTHKRKSSMPPVGFEPTILVSERPKTHALTIWVNITKILSSVYRCVLYGSQQNKIVIMSLYRINWLVFITETECVYCAVRTHLFQFHLYLYRVKSSYNYSTYCC